jgi:hypothetical protein
MNNAIMYNTKDIKEGDWIFLCNKRTLVYTLKILNSELLSIGYHQENDKVIRENIVWSKEKECWQFEKDGPCGSYLDGAISKIIKNGPYKKY